MTFEEWFAISSPTMMGSLKDLMREAWSAALSQAEDIDAATGTADDRLPDATIDAARRYLDRKDAMAVDPKALNLARSTIADAIPSVAYFRKHMPEIVMATEIMRLAGGLTIERD